MNMQTRIRTLIFACLVLIPAAGFAQSLIAELQGNILVVPEISSSGGSFQAEFQVLSNLEPVELILVASTPVDASGSLLAASFSEDLLTIPQAEIGGSSYWLELESRGDNRFVLVDYGQHRQDGFLQPWSFTHFPAWQQLHGFAYDVGVGANGDTWVIGTDPRPGGYGIYRLNGLGAVMADGGALRIDVEPDGRPWVVNFDHEIYRLDNLGFWERMPGEALDIGIGADGSVWVASFDGIFRWNGLFWDNFGGSGSRIDVGPNGQPWVVGFSDRIYTLIAGDALWTELPGEAGDIGVGADGSVWVVGTADDDDWDNLKGIYRWNSISWSWDRVVGDALDISVGPNGQPIVTNVFGEIYRAY